MQEKSSVELLKMLVSFDTTSYKSNLELITYVKHYLEQNGVAVTLKFNAENSKANLFARIGPADRQGILLSGHTDVVPVEGQAWSSDPFVAIEKNNRIFGRGTADMKGFIACAMVAMARAADRTLSRPLHLCLSYDEEIGCIGVRDILDQLSSYMTSPLVCIVGEPTLMQIATGHKGKAVFRALCCGQEGHSALAPQFTNAIHAAVALAGAITEVQHQVSQSDVRDSDYDIPYSTLHIGKIQGGKALNIVPNECILDYEIRNVVGDDVGQIHEAVVQRLETGTYAQWVHIEQTNQYPGLLTSPTIDAVRFLTSLLPEQTTIGKISFGTEGGLFTQTLECPVVVCGPGSITVAHKPDEFIELDQMHQCDAFLERLVQTLL
ncbi:MAG TPA: acetylornithine deacetylase [Advenella kashmirensis]|uniref:Acetylornithine deacetylase n=1 Tax=Advenella kashmirensis TaxID=310575 RepID=A0A356LID6_9BURK|nr:acetylornithine deacetylase [Advenella kashmirensis]